MWMLVRALLFMCLLLITLDVSTNGLISKREWKTGESTKNPATASNVE